jgi:aromatic-L-amino-acid/L-tryptophan decarboxylase
LNNHDFRRYGHQLIDWLADYFEGIEAYPVCSTVEPGEIRAALPQKPPSAGEQMDKIIADFENIILPGITHWQHPRWFAYFPANNSPESVLAELLAAGLGAQCMSWQTSPAATELEEVVMSWLRDMIGLPESMSGVIQDTASTSTLCALLTAREKATDFKTNLSGVRWTLTVYASEEAHSSIDKAVKIAGYGIDNLRKVPTDENYAMIPEVLEQMILEDLDQGVIPACVVATLGTTSSTAIDPLGEIGQICRKHDLWLHVDAAYGGAVALLEEQRQMFAGAEMIDSFVFNPHKWLLTNFDCSAYFVKNEKQLLRTFEILPEYLKTGHDAVVKNYRDWGIQLGRRFRALKLWFVIRSYGVEGLQQLIREHLRLAKLFQSWVEADSRFELMAPVHFGLVCFRLKKEGASEEELAKLNATLLQNVNATGQVYLTHTTLKGRFVIRMAIGQRTTKEDHVCEAWTLLTYHAGMLL